MNKRLIALVVGVVGFNLSGCGESGAGSGGDGSSSSMGETLQLSELPDPCDWLSVEEAQVLLGLDGVPRQMPMGDETSPGRTCVYTDADQTTWLNVTYQGLNPQIFDARGLGMDALIQLASVQYAHGMDHLESNETGDYPTLAFGDADQTIMVVFTNIGKARDLPEGLSERLSFSTIYNITMLMRAPGVSQDRRLEALNTLVERPVRQLRRVAG